MDLREALGVLSKASPFAVATANELAETELDELKKCLYVKTDIEVAFEKKLLSLKSDEIIFLCGSSGDGKSEILTKYKNEHERYAHFHLDATHSFEPKRNAIDTLNDIFTQYSDNPRALVVGINIDMLGNYARGEDASHWDTKKAINSFLDGEAVDSRYTFLDFESFPKFIIKDGKVSSPFFSCLLDNVVKDDKENKFREYFNKSLSEPKERILTSNYLMLRNPHVQSVVIELLLNARIRKDQFVTARMLLDFIYCILTGPEYLFDNLFNGGDNELLEVLSDFDPGVIRNQKLDLFVLHRTLELEDSDFQKFEALVSDKFNIPKSLSQQSIVRLFYLLKDDNTLDNSYHINFKGSFNEAPLQKYKEVWGAHNCCCGESVDEKWLNDFYSEIVLKAINKYANRSAPYLSKNEFYLSSHGSCDLLGLA
ncbi:MAG: DNA phosphorothioation-dependent restriction protein DptF [Endozoicomonadaceae bacterium]|nr:DNA phosphorothioation-dependent restriction protein DptF [Endozoicomonadaceae bacterium]